MNWIESKLPDDTPICIRTDQVIMVIPVRPPQEPGETWITIHLIDGSVATLQYSYEDFKHNFMALTTVH